MRTHLLLTATLALCLPACGDSASEPDPDELAAFACIGSVQPQVPVQSQVTFVGDVREFVGNGAVADARVAICALNDPTCATPIGTANTTALGTVSFLVPTGTAGFDGFGSVEKSGYVSQLVFARPAVAVARVIPYQVQMISNMAWTMFLMGAGVSQDPLRGHIALRAVDCDGNTAAGVSFALGSAVAGMTAAYVNELGVPRSTAPTDASGRGVFLNVPPGRHTAIATLVSTGKRIGTLDFLVRAGFVSGLTFPPTP